MEKSKQLLKVYEKLKRLVAFQAYVLLPKENQMERALTPILPLEWKKTIFLFFNPPLLKEAVRNSAAWECEECNPARMSQWVIYSTFTRGEGCRCKDGTS